MRLISLLTSSKGPRILFFTSGISLEAEPTVPILPQWVVSAAFIPRFPPALPFSTFLTRLGSSVSLSETLSLKLQKGRFHQKHSSMYKRYAKQSRQSNAKQSRRQQQQKWATRSLARSLRSARSLAPQRSAALRSLARTLVASSPPYERVTNV